MNRVLHRKKSGRNEKAQLSPFTAVLLAILLVYIATLLFLLLWAFMTSFKNGLMDYPSNKIGFPKPFTMKNYLSMFQNFYVRVEGGAGETAHNVGIAQMFGYTLLYALGCAFTSTAVPLVTSYACARYNKVLSKILYTVVIVTMVLPIVGSLPAEINMAKSLGLYDRIWGLWLMKAHFLGMYFLVFFSFFKSLPMAYTEAAQVDGAGNLSVMLRIIFPLAKNVFFTVLLINFITFWNDYQIPEVYLPSYPTIASGLFQMLFNNMAGKEFLRPTMRMTGAVVILIPILIIFLIFQKRLLGNLTMGGVKG